MKEAPLSPGVAESQWDGGGRVQIDPVWFHTFFTLFILCFLTIKELYVDTVAKELMSHKVYNFISSWLFLFFPDDCLSFLSAGVAGCAVPLRRLHCSVR